MSNYDDLKASVLSWPDLTGEQDLESSIDTIIGLGHARINRDLRVQDMLIETDYPKGSYSSQPLPADFLEAYRVYGPDKETLEYRPPAEFHRIGIEPKSPTYYTIEAGRIRFSPTVECFGFLYYARIPSIITFDNALYDKEPGLWLHSCLLDVAVFSKENEQELKRYRSSYNEVLWSVIAADIASLMPQSQSIRSAIEAGRKNGV